MSTLLEHALAAMRRGLRVFPCQPRLKIPATPNGAKEMTLDEARIRAWWSQNPDFNIGCNAGVIVDVDTGLHSAAEAIGIARIWGLPPTLTVHTGRVDGYGVQFHFTGDATAQGHFEANGCGGEIRVASRNYYGMAPGSVHPSGNVYEIIVDSPIAPYPQNLGLGPHRVQSEEHGPMTIEEIRSKMAYLFNEAAHAVPGCRNETAHRATYFAARGFLAGAFEQTESQIKRALFDAVKANYRSGERNIRHMLRHSWNCGLKHGPFEVYREMYTDVKGCLQYEGEAHDESV